MKPSTHCVYCGVLMNRIENHSQGRTVEHMIPQVSLSIKRNNGEGDFHVCRKCNGDKSRFDEIIGIICRIVGDETSGSFEAINKFHRAVKRNDSLFVKALNSVRITHSGPIIKIPLSAKELIQYGMWLAKGVYFLSNGKVLTNDKLIYVDVVSHKEVIEIKSVYRQSNNSDAFDDLCKNISIPNFNGESFIISGKDSKEYFICLNRVIMFHLMILENTASNQRLLNKARKRIQRGIVE